MVELDKKVIRKHYLNVRRNVSDKLEKSLAIMNKLIDTEEFKTARIIALYKSLRSEVDTDFILKYAINNGKTVVLPRVVGDKLLFYKIDSLDDTLEKSSFGIDEPINCSDKLVSDEDIELVIVPGVCFDLKRNRLGFGGGFYDRFLENKRLNTIGVCFDEQIFRDDYLPTENTDIKMNKIITESIIIDDLMEG